MTIRRRRKARMSAATQRVALAAEQQSVVQDVRTRAIIEPAVVNEDGVVLREAVRLREPTAVSAEWRDPQDSGRSIFPKHVYGFRAADPLLTLHKRFPKDYTKKHVDAAERLRNDYEIGHEGARPGYERLMREVGSTLTIAGDYTSVHSQAGALRRYQSAMKALGKDLADVIRFVVLGIGAEPGCNNLSAWAKRRGIGDDKAGGYLMAALDRLAEHYGVEEDGE
jgi:hypothetical protein